LSLCPEDGPALFEADADFSSTEYGRKIAWLKDYKQELYIPTYSDVLKTAFAYKYGKVKIADLVNLLSGKNPETKEVTIQFANQNFRKIREGIMDFMSEDNFRTFLSILEDGGYIKEKMIGSKGLMNGAYSMFLLMKEEGYTGDELASMTLRWYILNALTGRYQTSFENVVAKDFREVKEKGVKVYLSELERILLDESFFTEALPEKLKTTMIRSNSYGAYLAAMIKNGEMALFSKEKSMKDLVEEQVENSQLFPKVFLEKNGITSKDLYGQVANCIYMDKAVKTALKRKAPVEYLLKMEEEAETKLGKVLLTREEVLASLEVNAIPAETSDMTVADFEEFLYLRRKAMAEKIYTYYKSL